MKVEIAYVFPDLRLATYVPLARRFVASYLEHPPGASDHEVQVLVTGGHGQRLLEYERLFHPLPCRFRIHDNAGKDIGAYQEFSAESDADLVVFLGAPVHFTRAGWLDRIMMAYEENGPGLYGCWGFHQPMDHIRTTAFWCPPALLNSYPFQIQNRSRYEFEHGRTSITAHTVLMGLECYMVTWGEVLPRSQWRSVTNEECLFLDQHAERTVAA